MVWKMLGYLCFYGCQVKGWSSEASEEMRNVLRNETAEMQVFGEDGDALLVDLKKTSMADLKKTSTVSLREHLVFMELARCAIVLSGAGKYIHTSHARFFLIFI